MQSTVTCSPAEFAGNARAGRGRATRPGGSAARPTRRAAAWTPARSADRPTPVRGCGELFGLNSTRFSLRYADGVFRFDVRGYGHRVGMSQYGANAIARLGFDYQTILRYYYRGAKIETQKGSLV